MRKIRRKKRIKIYRVFIYIILFILITIIMNSAYSYIIQSLGIDGTSSIKKSETTIGSTCDSEVTYEINSWGNNDSGMNYRIIFTLENSGSKDYNGWNIYISIPSDFELTNYSSVEPEILGTTLKLSNVYYNSYVQAGQSTSFEIQFTTSNTNYEPSNISTNDCYINHDSESSSDNLQVTFNFVTQNDTNTYQYDVVVTNISSSAITNWSFEIVKPSNASIINSWNTNYIVKDETIEFSNMSYNGNLSLGGSTTFGLILYTDEYQFSPKLYE